MSDDNEKLKNEYDNLSDASKFLHNIGCENINLMAIIMDECRQEISQATEMCRTGIISIEDCERMAEMARIKRDRKIYEIFDAKSN